jgi:DNA-binding NtrC family response regulator
VSDRSRPSILLVDPDADFRRAAGESFDSSGCVAAHSPSYADALSRLDGFAYDGLIVDVRLPDGDGLDVLDLALTRYPGMRAIVTSHFGSIHHAVKALKRGAIDYLLKPVPVAQMVETMKTSLAARRAEAAGAPAVRRTDREFEFGGIVGASPAMKRLFQTMELVSPMQSTVLIQGETGTGKELVARTIHDNSSRRDQAFVAFNSAAIPEGLVEAELFGHVKGAFTGAVYSRVGRFEAADRGTLFIDEVSSMSLPLQAKLLRALQEKEIERVGTSRPLKINVRVVAASNVDLQEMVKAGTFREDLYYRLNVVRVSLPPLRARREDIPLLSQHFVRESCRQNDLPVKSLGQATLQALMAFAWPGNIRQLQNAIESAVAMSGGAAEIEPAMLPDEVLGLVSDMVAGSRGGSVAIPATPDEGINFVSTMTQVERDLILRYLEKANGNKRQAARLLNLSRTTLIDKLHRLGVTEPSSAVA